MAFRNVPGRRAFAPSLLMTVLTAALSAAFVSLGVWQWGRYEHKQELWRIFERGVDRVMPLGSRATTSLERFARVSVEGYWDARRQFLLDNRSLDGRPGYEVLTPLRLLDGRWLLVNRGWVPFSGYRDRLPEISMPARREERAQIAPSQRVTGRLDELPASGLERGRAPPSLDAAWPKVTSFPSSAELAAALGERIEPRVLLLDPDDPASSYERRWRPPGVAPATHWAYAIQWWCFAAVLLVLYVVLNVKRNDA